MNLKWSESLPIILFFSILLLTSSVWLFTINSQSATLQDETELVSTHVSHEIQENIEARLDLIEIFAREWVHTDNSTHFYNESRFLLKTPDYFNHYSGFLAINWINTSGVIEWVYPADENSAALNKNITYLMSGGLNYAFSTAKTMHEVGLTNVTSLFQGGTGIVSYHPLIYLNETTQSNQTVGYFNVVIQINPFIEEVIADNTFIHDYSFHLLEYDIEIFHYQEEFDKDSEYTVKKSFTFYNRTWDLYVLPLESKVFEASPLGNALTLVLGILISIIISISVFKANQASMKLGLSHLERDKIQRQLFKSQKMEALGTLAGGLAHDYNNILMGIIGNVDLLQMSVGEIQEAHADIDLEIAADIQDSFESIKSLIKRAKDLSNSILTFSQNREITLSSVNIIQMIQKTIHLFTETMDKRIKIKSHFKELNVHILGDPTKLQQIFMNLIVNAKDALPQGGLIEIRTNSRNTLPKGGIIEVLANPKDTPTPTGHIEIEIKDNGIGIKEENLFQIFDPFFTTKDIGKGTGLGLSIAALAIKEMKGFVSVKSKLGEGTTFIIQFPITSETLSENEPQDIDIPDAKLVKILEGKNILVVEDETVIVKNIEQFFKKFNCNVRTAADGQIGLDIFEKNSQQLDLVILDINMPKILGTELFRKMKELNQTQRILFMTGYSMKEIPGKGDDTVELLLKPFSHAELKKKIVSIFL